MVTWGQNQVHPVPANPSTAPPPPSLSASPSTSSFGFGAPAPGPSTGGSFFGGTPAPTNTLGGSLFGGAPAPAQTGFFSGAPSPSPSTSTFFGSPPATTSVFGAGSPAPTGSLFGSSATSAFGNPTQQQQQQPQPHIPAQAALLAHMDASARQESQRIKAKLDKIKAAYSGQAIVREGSDESSKFVAVTYNYLTPQQKHMQILGKSYGVSGIVEPPRPPQVSPRQWEEACVKNPDPTQYAPVAMMGAAALLGRISWQQEQAEKTAANAKSIHSNLEFIRNREIQTRKLLYEKERKYVTLRHRLMQVMEKVEITRSLSKPFQTDEYIALQRLQQLLDYAVQMRSELTTLQNQAATQHQELQKQYGNALVETATTVDKKELLGNLTVQRSKITTLLNLAKKDRRDLTLMGEKVVSTLSGPY
ncbi:MAG: hypothetical protein SGILL_000016 [Bacillariaceae sp.]